MTQWKLVSMSDVPSNHTRYIECEDWGFRLVTKNQHGDVVEATDWNRSAWATPMAQLDYALRHFGVALNDNANSLAGTHQVSLTAQKNDIKSNWVDVEIRQRPDSVLYEWRVICQLNNGIKTTSEYSLGHGLSQLALEEAMEAVGRAYNCIMYFIPEPQAEEV